VLDQFGQLFSAAQVALVSNAGLAEYAGALDEVVVEAIAFFLFDEGSHTG
jgi:hypothetical protein